MFSMLIEVILQGGVLFYLHPIVRHIVVEGINWYTSCMYLFLRAILSGFVIL